MATLPSDLADLTTGAVEVGPGSLDSLESLRRGSTRSLADLGTLPIVLSPRLLITDTRPAFRWTAVDGATAYEVKVQGRGETLVAARRRQRCRRFVCSAVRTSLPPTLWRQLIRLGLARWNPRRPTWQRCRRSFLTCKRRASWTHSISNWQTRLRLKS